MVNLITITHEHYSQHAAVYLHPVLLLIFAVSEIFTPSLGLESFQLKPIVTGSHEDLIETLFITDGFMMFGFASLFIYAISYKDHQFLTALLRVLFLWWSVQIYLTTRAIAWSTARKLSLTVLHANMALCVVMAPLSFFGSFVGPKK